MTADSYIPLPGRAVIAISGEDARSFLQGLITNDIDLVAPARAIWAALLTPQGKYLHDFFIAEHDDRLLLDCEEARLDDLIKRLKMYRLRAKAEIADERDGWDICALAGDGTDPGASVIWHGGVAFTDPRHPEMGRRAILPKGTIEDAGLNEAPFEDYAAKRIALGIPEAGADLIADKSMPLETGFDELNGVDFDKGCYVGQEVTARMKHRSLVKKRLIPIRVDGDAAPGTPVKSGDVEAGQVHSVGDGRALALIRLDLLEKGGLTVDGAPVTPEKPDWAVF